MKHNNIRITGRQEGEEESEGIENLFEKVITEKFPNLMREKIHRNPGNKESPKQDEPKEAH